jgi:hypothetical protein
VLLAICATGCNGLLGLDPTREIDAAPDAPRVLTPTSVTPPCPSPAAFETWQTQSAGVAPRLGGIAFYGAPTGDRAIVSRADNDRWHMYDTDLMADYVRIASLTPENPAVALGSVGLSPDGEVLWFAETGDVVLATRASGWTRQTADLGFTGSPIQPGNVGYYANTARMVIAVQTGGTLPRLVELSSTDGLHWEALTTILFQPPGFNLASPALSADGCVLFFVATDAMSGRNSPRVSYRDTDGTFRSATAMPDGTVDRNIVAPTPDLSRLWTFDVTPGTQATGFTVWHP